MKWCRILSVCLFGLSVFAGCGDGKEDVTKERLKEMSGGELKEVVPVKGIVNIDGSPATGVNLLLFSPDNPKMLVKECRTNEKGEYCWSTYEACDGLAPGTYVVGFTHIPKPKKDDSGVDLFKGKYKDPKNRMELKVENGAPQEKTEYNLATK